MTTTTEEGTVQSALNKANTNLTADLLAKIKAGFVFSPIKVTVSGATSSATQDIDSDDTKANATIVGISPALDAGVNLPLIGQVLSLRVTAGTADAGDRAVTDSGGSAAAKGTNGVGIATLTDDGKTLEFEAAVTGYVITYFPRAEGITDSFPLGAP